MVVQQQQQQERQQEMAKMIRIDDHVHKELTELGKKGESYSDLIKRLVEFYKKEMKSKK
jgi:predicted CopG family antitoxin